MEDIINPTSDDLLRETIIILIGLIVRAIEKRKLKKEIKKHSPKES
jgi:hypothetical protein